MNKDKLAAAKKKFKKNAPVFVAAISTVTAIATVVYYQTKMTLDTSKEELEAMESGDTEVTYSIDGNDYALRYVGNTPEK
jgi:hypothetical protein